jgi:hypothetical protein
MILDDLANAWEKLGNFRKTRDNLAKWRESAPPDERPTLDMRIQNLDARIAREDEAARKAAEEKAAREARERAVVTPTQDRSWLPGVIVGSIGAAAVIAGVSVDIVANGKRPPSALCMKSPTGQTLCQTSAEGPITTSNRMAIAGDVTWILGTVAVAAGVALVFVRRPHPADAAPPPRTAWLAPTPGGVLLGGSF